MDHVNLSDFDVADSRPNRPWLILSGPLPPTPYANITHQAGISAETKEPVAYWLVPIKPVRSLSDVDDENPFSLETVFRSPDPSTGEVVERNVSIDLPVEPDVESGRTSIILGLIDIPWLCSVLGQPPPYLGGWSKWDEKEGLVPLHPLTRSLVSQCIEWLSRHAPAFVSGDTLWPRTPPPPERFYPRGSLDTVERWISTVSSGGLAE